MNLNTGSTHCIIFDDKHMVVKGVGQYTDVLQLFFVMPNNNKI